MIEARDIMKMLPHRYPFLLVDRVLSHTNDELVAIKNVTFNEPFFPGHFPGEPTMPGVLMLEAMAQACGLLAVIRSGVRSDSGLILYFAGIDNARFKRPVTPGDQLRFEVQLVKQKRDIWKFTAKAMVGNDLACCAELMCVLRHPDKMQEGS
jgi:3-hydroxyacyl-[acyl-carrier-protein] dehydratase